MRPDYSEFNRRLTVEKATVTTDARGNEVRTWAAYHSCYAGVKPYDEYVQTEERRPDYNTVTEFKLRYCAKAAEIVPETYRIRYGGTIHRILTATDVNAEHKIVKIKAVVDSGKAAT